MQSLFDVLLSCDGSTDFTLQNSDRLQRWCHSAEDSPSVFKVCIPDLSQYEAPALEEARFYAFTSGIVDDTWSSQDFLSECTDCEMQVREAVKILNVKNWLPLIHANTDDSMSPLAALCVNTADPWWNYVLVFFEMEEELLPLPNFLQALRYAPFVNAPPGYSAISAFGDWHDGLS